jgi:hypothetical protein
MCKKHDRKVKKNEKGKKYILWKILFLNAEFRAVGYPPEVVFLLSYLLSRSKILLLAIYIHTDSVFLSCFIQGNAKKGKNAD